MMSRLIEPGRFQEVYALLGCGLVIGLSWIIQREATTLVPTYEFAGQLLNWQGFVEPMAIYGAGLLVINIWLWTAAVRRKAHLIGVLLAILTGFWAFMAACSAVSVLNFAINEPDGFWYNLTHARNTFAGFGTALGFGLWHYYASTRDET